MTAIRDIGPYGGTLCQGRELWLRRMDMAYAREVRSRQAAERRERLARVVTDIQAGQPDEMKKLEETCRAQMQAAVAGLKRNNETLRRLKEKLE